MEIHKSCDCCIVVKKGDRVSNILVTRETDEYNKLGKVEPGYLPSPTSEYKYICTILTIEGGSVSNVEVRNGGSVNLYGGKLKNIYVNPTGGLNIHSGEATDIYEFGGQVNILTMHGKSDPKVSFFPTEFSPDVDYGFCSIHKGNVLNYTTIGNEAIVYNIGGLIENVTFSGGDTYVQDYGVVDHCHLNYGRIIIKNTGVVKNTEFAMIDGLFYRCIVLDETAKERCLVNCKISAGVEIVSRTDNFKSCFKNCEIQNGVRVVQAVFTTEKFYGSKVISHWQNYIYEDGVWKLEDAQLCPRQKHENDLNNYIKEKHNAVRPQN